MDRGQYSDFREAADSLITERQGRPIDSHDARETETSVPRISGDVMGLRLFPYLGGCSGLGLTRFEMRDLAPLGFELKGPSHEFHCPERDEQGRWMAQDLLYYAETGTSFDLLSLPTFWLQRYPHIYGGYVIDIDEGNQDGGAH